MENSRRDSVDACIYIDENDHTYRVQLAGKKTRIGTTTDCDVLLKDRSALGTLGEFIATRRSFEFRSVGTRAVTLNGHPVRENQRLYHGDVLSFGETRVRYFQVPEVSEVTLQFGIAGLHSGHSFFLTNQSFVRIGQTVGELRIPDSTLGDPHVAIENLGPDALFIRQMGAETETTVNGTKLNERVAIEDGAVVQMGETHLTIRTLPNIPLPAPAEVLLKPHGAVASDAISDDDLQTAPEKLRTIRHAHIRAGGHVKKLTSDQMQRLTSTPSRKRGDDEASRVARASAPTPQPYLIRQQDLQQARQEMAPLRPEAAYYLPGDKRTDAERASSSSKKPYYIDHNDRPPDLQSEPKQKPSHVRDNVEVLSSRPYYVPKPGTESRMGERDSPLDWMEDVRVRTDDDDAGATSIFAVDADANTMAHRKKYYVPSEGAPEPETLDWDPSEDIPDRAGTTLHDTSLDELD